MRKSLFTLLSLALFVTIASAQKFPSIDQSPLDVAYFPNGLQTFEIRKQDAVEPQIKLYYSRPQLKGREMIGKKAAPYGKVWRLGANEANEITFYQDVTFGDAKVKAGTYALFAVPGETEWEFILSTKLNTWGNYTTPESAFVARAKANSRKADETIEALSIMFTEVDGGAHMVFGWENTVVELPIKF